MAGFRLVEAGVAGGGPLTLSRVYDTVDEACTVAERMLDALERYPHRRPYAYRVVDVDTGELVTTIRPDGDRDWDPDPFAGALGSPGLWDTGPETGPAPENAPGVDLPSRGVGPGPAPRES